MTKPSKSFDEVDSNSVTTDVLQNKTGRKVELSSARGSIGANFNEQITGLSILKEDVTTAYSSADAITGSHALKVTFDDTDANGSGIAFVPAMEDASDHTKHYFNHSPVTFSIAFKVLSTIDTRINAYFKNTIPFRIGYMEGSPGTLTYSDGGALSGDTGVTVDTGSLVQMTLTLDFANDQYSFDGIVTQSGGNREPISASNAAFEDSVDAITDIEWLNSAGTTGEAFALDRFWMDKPVILCLGDSITSGTNHLTSNNGSDAYPSLLNDRQDNYIFVRNTNGGNHGEVTWGYEYLDRILRQTGARWVILAYGVHSVLEDAIDKGHFVNQYMATMEEARSLGVRPIGWLMTRTADVGFDLQKDWVETLQTRLEDEGYPYINAWDAVDSSPDDGNFDQRDTSLYDDKTHPNSDGHVALADRIEDTLDLN